MPDIKDLVFETLNSLNPNYSNLVEDVVFTNKKIYLSLAADKSDIDKFEKIRDEIETAISNIEGVEGVSISLTSHSTSEQSTKGNKEPSSGVSQVKNIISVASGKGGVGKSTVSINLAIAISKLGFSVGLLDADIYGPSIPKLIGGSKKPNASSSGNILPIEKYNISLMSIGFLISEDTAMIWRGPMVISAVNQMLNDVEWGELDYLIVDMPPGTVMYS